MHTERLSIMILVKTAPIVTPGLGESRCVAGVTLDNIPRWIRLFPIPFRDLGDDIELGR